MGRGRQWWLGLGSLLSGWIVLSGRLFDGSGAPGKVLHPDGSGMTGILPAAVCVFFCLAAMILAFWPQAHAAAEKTAQARRDAGQPIPARRWFQTDRMRRIFALSLFVIGWVAVWLALDGRGKAVAQMDYYASRKEYNQVLAVAGRLKALDPASEVRLHLALYHTGRLGQDLFSFTNQTVWNLTPAPSTGSEACLPQSETLLELGQVNLAEHFAHEALECEGARPDILRLLARINILKGRPQAARVFLKVLGQVPFQGTWADKCLHELETNPLLPNHQELAQIRSRMVSSDLAHDALPTDSVLLQLLHANPRNQMAFEYLMAHYLLTRQPDKLVQELGRLSDFPDADLPRHYEEAVLHHQKLKGGAAIDLRGRQIRPETVSRFGQFSEAINRRVHKSAEGRQALARDFGDTFWNYFFCLRQRVTDKPAARSAESS